MVCLSFPLQAALCEAREAKFGPWFTCVGERFPYFGGAQKDICFAYEEVVRVSNLKTRIEQKMAADSNCTRSTAAAAPNVTCTADEFSCGDGRSCIPLAYRCDTAVDCKNGADEARCGRRGRRRDPGQAGAAPAAVGNASPSTGGGRNGTSSAENASLPGSVPDGFGPQHSSGSAGVRGGGADAAWMLAPSALYGSVDENQADMNARMSQHNLEAHRYAAGVLLVIGALCAVYADLFSEQPKKGMVLMLLASLFGIIAMCVWVSRQVSIKGADGVEDVELAAGGVLLVSGCILAVVSSIAYCNAMHKDELEESYVGRFAAKTRIGLLVESPIVERPLSIMTQPAVSVKAAVKTLRNHSIV